jgi:SAM-dependent methyltransferase
MGISDHDRETVRKLITDTVLGLSFRKATFSGAARKDGPSPWVRVVIRPVKLRSERHLQFSYFDSHKDTTKNYRPDEVHTHLDELVNIAFAGIHLSTASEEIDIRTTKKGRVQIGRRELANSSDSNNMSPLGETHNRTKDVPLPEGRANRLLEVMGILTSDGRVRPTMRPKYTQINEFLKHLLHVLETAELRSIGREVEILDCGCGSSYLTLAVYHYLNDVLALPARITGVDVNEEVIRKSTARAERLSMSKLAFACGRIREIAVRPDIVLALHACDTATDDAIAQAIRCEAKLLLSVPCCHQNLNKAIRPNETVDVLRPMLRHGILHQRTADLVTDAFRALALRIMGYHTDVVEFIGTEHTARNLMIRAVRGASIGEVADIREYLAMRQFWNVTPYIEKLLGEPFQQLLMRKETR